jgi:ATP-dependent protease ClpP protease subunit
MQKLIAFVLFFVTSVACGATFQPTPDRTLVFAGPVDVRATLFAGAVMQMSLHDASQPIDLLINSDGGDVREGAQLITAIEFAKSLGVDVRCVNIGHAISMGFMIISHCSHRYATPASVSMFHYPKVVMGAASSETLRENADRLKDLEEAFIVDLAGTLKRPKELIREHALEETMWTPEELNAFSPGFYEVVDGVQGVTMTLLFQ